MKKQNLLLSTLIFCISFNAHAVDNAIIIPDQHNNTFNYLNNNNSISDDWIKTKNINSKSSFYLINDKISFSEELGFAWNLNNFLKLNLSLYENQSYANGFSQNQTNFNKNTKNLVPTSQSKLLRSSKFPNTNNTSNRLFGYKLGVSSELGLGNNYKLGLNINYGLLEGANLLGFNTNEINTTSFGLGIRKNKFGASLKNEIFLDSNHYSNDSNLFGFELDWHFSDETTLSIGSKHSIENNSTTNNQNILETLTGNVQYIKFKHNL